MSKFKKWSLRIGGIVVVLIVVGLIVFWKDIQEIRGVLRYAKVFEPDKIVANFKSLYNQYPHSTVHRSGEVYVLKKTRGNCLKAMCTRGKPKKLRTG